ncbi:hypothetical protein GGU10DRAFT_371012 [Lentinula aff. detonsa]|uniref:Uncharacterized protein n=1 Tax=Lentinula aff. detonsa TaxID=2804958 RepID=A0AA38NT76_9AGAR|nr:hypothetical protein GGU10DRAFT_371012 [Lentinula aff. detonsa]
MSTTTTSTSSLTTTSSASSTAVPPLSSPTTSTRSVPSFTPTTTSTSSSITLPVTTTSSSFTSSSSSDTLTSSSKSMTASSKSSSSPSSTSTQSISSSTPAPSSTSTSSSTSVSSTSLSSTSVPVSTSGSGSTTTESQTVPSSSPSSTSPMTGTSMTATQSHTTTSSSSSPSSTPSATDTGSSSTPTPSHSSSSGTQSMTGTSLSPTSHTSSMIGTSSSGGLSTGMTFSMTRSLSSVSGSQTMSHSSSPGTISSPSQSSQSSQPTQTFSTTIGTTSPPVTTGPFSATTSRSSAPSTGAGTGTDGSSAFTGHETSTSGSTISSGQTSSAPSSSSSSAGSIGTGSSSGLSRQVFIHLPHLIHSNHLSTILPILLPLLLLLFLLSAFYLCRRKQLRRGMNVFGQRLELGETPEAWWRLGEPGNTVTSNIGHEAGSTARDEEKQQHQRRGQNVDQTVPNSSEKRSVYAIAASIVGRVGVPAKPDNLSHGKDIDFSYSDEEKETLKDKFEGVTRTVGGPISTLAASVAKRKYLPMGKQNRSESGDRGQRPSEYASPPSSSSSPMPYPTPPSSRFSSRNHTPFPLLPFTFYRATNSSSRTDFISPVQDVPATASVTDTDITVSDQVSYMESLTHSRLDPDDFETEIQVSGQQGYIPIMRTGTRVLADSSSSSISGMEYIPFMSRDTDLDSYMQTAPRTPSTRSLDLTRTHTSQSANSDMIVSSPPPPRCENASEISCISQNSRNTQDTRNTGNSYGTQDTVETTSSLSFAQPKIIRTSASQGNDPVSKGETTEVPLVTSTFHYSPNPEDEDDIALGSSSRLSPGLASKNPFHPSNALFHPDPLYTSNQSYEKDVALNSFIRTLEWRRRAMAHADNTGQGPSLMEAVEVYFAPSNSNTDSSPGSPT